MANNLPSVTSSLSGSTFSVLVINFSFKDYRITLGYLDKRKEQTVLTLIRHRRTLGLIRIYTAMFASVAQLDAPSDWRPGGRGFNPRRGRQHSFVEIDHEIFSTVILSLPLIQEGQLSVSGERLCTILVSRLED